MPFCDFFIAKNENEIAKKKFRELTKKEEKKLPGSKELLTIV